MELTERQRAILKMVVEDYVLTTAPVPSERVAGRPGLKVSSATVRNEMVELEEMGLLTHPHTSAGRIPSDVGYRYYIEHLMTESGLTPMEEQTIWHQFHQVEAEVDQWGPLAAAVTAQMARSASLVTRPYPRESRIKRIELISVQEDLVLVVLILRSGAVQQRMLHLEEPIERVDLIRIANKLSDLLQNNNRYQVARKASRLWGVEGNLALVIARLMEQSEHNWGESLCYEGIGFASGEPEFGRAERLIELMEVLQRGSILAPLLSDAVESEGLLVIIGSENETERMRGYSLILKRYGLVDQAAGVVGVVGPTRMRYWRAVSMVRFMAELLDRLTEQSLH